MQATQKQVEYIRDLVAIHLKGQFRSSNPPAHINYRDMLEDNPSLEIPATWEEYCGLVHEVRPESLSEEEASQMIEQLKKLGAGVYDPDGYVRFVRLLRNL